MKPCLCQRMLAASGLVLLLIVAAVVYTSGLSGGWQFDDHANLAGLENVHDLTTGLAYSTSGIAGPLKRPVALASFALQAERWPDHPEHFLRVNLVIHLVNGVMIWLLCLQLARLLTPDMNSRHAGFALTVAGAWLLAPFLASASLMAVQRMTTLSASFVFAGLIGYLAGRRKMASQPSLGLWLALFSLGFGTLLAVFTKENGALLPLLALMAEILIVRRTRLQLTKLPKLWFIFALALPSLLVIGYLTYRGILPSGYERRSFTLAERLLTQARVLWDYIFNLLLPNPQSVTPYMDGYTASRSLFQPMTTSFSILGLAGLLLAALFYRHRLPALNFGLLFFFGAHLVESTTIPLELYFAHRNYVAAFGLYFAIGWLIFYSAPSRKIKWLAPVSSALFIGISATSLLFATTLWGQPETAAAVWYQHNPGSVRAAQAMAATYAANDSFAAADEILTKGLEHNPEHQMLTLQRLEYCTGKLDHEYRLQQAQEVLEPPTSVELSTAILLHRWIFNEHHFNCPWIDQKAIEQLVKIAVQPGRSQESRSASAYLHYALAHIAQSRMQTAEMRRQLKQAQQAKPHDPQTPTLIAYSWILEEDLPAARSYLHQQLANPLPMNPFQRRAWQREIREYLGRLGD